MVRNAHIWPLDSSGSTSDRQGNGKIQDLASISTFSLELWSSELKRMPHRPMQALSPFPTSHLPPPTLSTSLPHAICTPPFNGK